MSNIIIEAVRRKPVAVAVAALSLVTATILVITSTSDSMEETASQPETSVPSTQWNVRETSSTVPTTPTNTEQSPPGSSPALAASAATAKLAVIPVKGRAPKTGYHRDLFGDAWTDDVAVEGGRNGCDTRNDVLRRDLVDVVVKPNSNGCAVLAGTLQDPYTGDTVQFQRGENTSSQVQIDHIVALSDSWQKGAQGWDPDTRRNFANDPRNLQATIGSVNQQKRDGDAATWLPPAKAYRCTYVSRIVDVKAAYGLWVTQAEHDAIAGVLATCAETSDGDASELPPVQAQPSTSSETTLAPPAPAAPAVPDQQGAYYPDCRAARSAGEAPIYAGQPGYRPQLDGDGDGVACDN